MGCGGYGEAPALRQLWNECQAAYPGRVTFLGICGDSRHCPGSSDHCKGNALDIGTGSDDNLAWHIAELVLRDRRCRYIIHDARGRRAYWRGGSWFSSRGHDTHVHVSIDGALRNQTHSWGISGNVTPTGGGGGSSYSNGPGYWEASASNPIKQGHKGEGVRHVQQLLADWGYPVGKVDGLAGPKFTQSVKRFQRDAGIKQDGLVGPQTRAKMEDRYYHRGKWASRGNPNVAAFQRLVGTAADGIWGPKTEHKARHRANWVGWKKRVGNRREMVVLAQQQLNRVYGNPLKVDGIVGPVTNHAIVVLHGERDGILGPRAWKRLLHK